MNSQGFKKLNLPDSPGVYKFLGKKKEVLYIGKATSLKDRVKSYFGKDLIKTRGTRLVQMVEEAKYLEYTTTDSVLEAMILEANEIKKHQPYYNAKEKDDRSYNYVTISKEAFPKVFITRGSGTYGPYPHATELREALKIVRKIFPFRDEKCQLKNKPCFNAQIGLCPGPCAGWISKHEYRKNIRNIKLFFEAKKPKLIKTLEEEMGALAKKQKFEEAEKIKRQIFALDHIQDIALIRNDLEASNNKLEAFRIEAYDIAHMSGKNAVGVMVVVEDGELNKSQYRKFKIKIDKNDDVGNLREVLERRLNHPEWKLPDLIVVDGGEAQINVAKKVVAGKNIQVVSVVKDARHKARAVVGSKKYVERYKKEILLANAEAHRFAINYHRRLRGKGFRI